MSYALGDIECAGTLRFPGGGTPRSTADGSWRAEVRFPNWLRFRTSGDGVREEHASEGDHQDADGKCEARPPHPDPSIVRPPVEVWFGHRPVLQLRYGRSAKA